MTGVYTAVYVLTVACFGECFGMTTQQRLDVPSLQACEFIRDVMLRERNALRFVDASCIGEAREVSATARTTR